MYRQRGRRAVESRTRHTGTHTHEQTAENDALSLSLCSDLPSADAGCTGRFLPPTRTPRPSPELLHRLVIQRKWLSLLFFFITENSDTDGDGEKEETGGKKREEHSSPSLQKHVCRFVCLFLWMHFCLCLSRVFRSRQSLDGTSFT